MCTFAKSACFQVPKYGTFSAQIYERTPKTSRNTSQNGGGPIWFMHFHFRASQGVKATQVPQPKLRKSVGESDYAKAGYMG